MVQIKAQLLVQLKAHELVYVCTQLFVQMRTFALSYMKTQRLVQEKTQLLVHVHTKLLYNKAENLASGSQESQTLGQNQTVWLGTTLFWLQLPTPVNEMVFKVTGLRASQATQVTGVTEDTHTHTHVGRAPKNAFADLGRRAQERFVSKIFQCQVHYSEELLLSLKRRCEITQMNTREDNE